MKRIRVEILRGRANSDQLDKFRKFVLANCPNSYADQIVRDTRFVLDTAESELRRSDIYVGEFGPVEIWFVRPGKHLEVQDVE